MLCFHPTLFLVFITLFLGSISPVAHANSDGPIVNLPDGQYQGFTNNTSGLSYFLGMRFASPPINSLRYNKPQPPLNFSGVQDASRYGAACLQQTLTNLTVPGIGALNLAVGPPSNQSEDCLFVNVIKPTTIPPNAKLPVVFWIFPGAFETGDTSQFDGSPVVERSVALGEPVIYVSANYRLNGYGFLASKEIQDAGVGNLGLRDQRFAMEWVQQNIHKFGGDKDKVTIWGASAGALSVGFHLLVNDGNPAGLFRGAFMNSGSPLPVGDSAGGQPYYDVLVNESGCSNSTDTLECLRTIPAETLSSIILSKTPNVFSFQGIQLAYLPRVDGDLIKKNPWGSISEGAYAKVPFVTGDCHDDGTLFTLPDSNITTSEEFLNYVHKNIFPEASAAQIEEIGELYPENPAMGSPFGTGNASILFPQYKRLAAFEGDAVFQATRRFLLTNAFKTQNVWAFDYRRSSALTPALGIYHGSDGFTFGYLGTTPDFQGTDAVINFINHLTPVPEHQNSSLSSVDWPTWGSSPSHPALTFWDPTVLNVTSDTEREGTIRKLTALMHEFPFGFTDLPVEA